MAGLDPISNVADAAAKIISLFKADPNIKQTAAANLELTELQGQIQITLEQLRINAVEAANKSIFVSGWRPGIGWICGFALAYTYIVQPFLTFFLVAFKIGFDAAKLPVINTSELMILLGGLLGLGGMRTYEKVQGAAQPGNIGH